MSQVLCHSSALDCCSILVDSVMRSSFQEKALLRLPEESFSNVNVLVAGV